LLTAYAYLFIMEQQKAQGGSEALQLQVDQYAAGAKKIVPKEIVPNPFREPLTNQPPQTPYQSAQQATPGKELKVMSYNIWYGAHRHQAKSRGVIGGGTRQWIHYSDFVPPRLSHAICPGGEVEECQSDAQAEKLTKLKELFKRTTRFDGQANVILTSDADFVTLQEVRKDVLDILENDACILWKTYDRNTLWKASSSSGTEPLLDYFVVSFAKKTLFQKGPSLQMRMLDGDAGLPGVDDARKATLHCGMRQADGKRMAVIGVHLWQQQHQYRNFWQRKHGRTAEALRNIADSLQHCPGADSVLIVGDTNVGTIKDFENLPGNPTMSTVPNITLTDFFDRVNKTFPGFSVVDAEYSTDGTRNVTASKPWEQMEYQKLIFKGVTISGRERVLADDPVWKAKVTSVDPSFMELAKASASDHFPVVFTVSPQV
jgi:endonuclease/exonuclease/phosphatase family metal-dependent hydrolase